VHLDLRYVPFTSHVPFGKVVSATPNGRKAWTPLSDGSSASQGADRSGPTAVLLSNFATKNLEYRERAARLLNMPKLPVHAATRHAQTGLLHPHLVRPETLARPVQRHQPADAAAAQRDPEKYRSLIVRIAGYSAYFVDLSPDLQNDLIARTGHEQM
jgi:formate C-acetyltransferase